MKRRVKAYTGQGEKGTFGGEKSPFRGFTEKGQMRLRRLNQLESLSLSARYLYRPRCPQAVRNGLGIIFQLPAGCSVPSCNEPGGQKKSF